MVIVNVHGKPFFNKAVYLEADNVGGYEHPDTLDEVSQSVDEGSSYSQAAVLPLLLT